MKKIIGSINWKVRAKSKAFWIALVSAILLLAQAILGLLGIEFSFTEIESRLIDLINAIFVLLAVLGVVVDPTTEGLADSKQALTYTEPRKS